MSPSSRVVRVYSDLFIVMVSVLQEVLSTQEVLNKYLRNKWMDLSMTLSERDIAFHEHARSLLPLNFPDFWFRMLECSFMNVKQWNLIECSAWKRVGFLYDHRRESNSHDFKFQNVIYCRVKHQVTKKRFYKYYVFFFPHLIKRKATLMLIWGSALTKFKTENN